MRQKTEMIKEKTDIFAKPYVDKGAYKVPDGYFDTLNDRIMDRVKASPSKAEIRRLPWLRYAVAASLVAVAVMTGTMVYQSHQDSQAMAEEKVEYQGDSYSEQYKSDFYDYAMVDGDEAIKYMIK